MFTHTCIYIRTEEVAWVRTRPDIILVLHRRSGSGTKWLETKCTRDETAGVKVSPWLNPWRRNGGEKTAETKRRRRKVIYPKRLHDQLYCWSSAQFLLVGTSVMFAANLQQLMPPCSQHFNYTFRWKAKPPLFSTEEEFRKANIACVHWLLVLHMALNQTIKLNAGAFTLEPECTFSAPRIRFRSVHT